MLFASVLVIAVTTFILWFLFIKSRTQTFAMDGTVIKIARTTNECIALINELESHSPKVVGLDCEWICNNNKVSLLQIGHKNLTILIRLHLLDFIPLNLINFLRDVTILKCGVGIFGDVNKLRGHWNIQVLGCVDINHLFKTVIPKATINTLLSSHSDRLNQTQKNTLSLKSMSEIFLNAPMKYKAKHWSFHQNWECKALNKEQIFYAADDALKGFQIFVKVMSLIGSENKSYLELCYKCIDSVKVSNNIGKNEKRKRKISNNTQLANNAKNIQNKEDALQFNECMICETTKNELIMFSLIPAQYKPFICPKYDSNKYRIPVCIDQCFKKCKNIQSNFVNEIHQRHDCVIKPNKKLFKKAKTAASALSNENIKYKISPKLRIKMLTDICDYFNINNTVSNSDEKKCENDSEYKWQCYDNTSHTFIDFNTGISSLIERYYAQNKRKMLISNLKQYTTENSNETLSEGLYYICNENSSLFWDVIGNGKKNGVHIHQWRYHGGGNQIFQFHKSENGNGKYYIECMNSRKYLCIDNDGVLVQNMNKTYEFTMANLNENGLFNIICANANKAIEIEHQSLSKAAKVIAKHDLDLKSENQKFRLFQCCDEKKNNKQIEIEQINFDKMESVKGGTNKREIRRLFAKDVISDISYDQFIKINLCCLVGISTNYLIDFCVQQLLNRNNNIESGLQEERWTLCKKELVEKYQRNGKDFKQIWVSLFQQKVGLNIR